MSEENSPKGRAGGEERARKLSPERRREIARKAGAARWKIPCASHDGKLNLGGWKNIPCWVLDDERRIISQRSFMEVIGMGSGTKTPIGERVSQILDPRNLRSDSATALVKEVDHPIKFLTTESLTSYGYDGEIIVNFCNAVLYARRVGNLTGATLDYADQAERLLVAVAKTGIAALIDEATGYQEIRDRRALEVLLDKYLLHEFSAWAKRFPDEFYQEIFRLKGWEWMGMKVNRPSCVGRYTNDLVYKRLEVGILNELRLRNPWIPEQKRRAGYHHCLLTENLGVPALAQHLHTVITIMRGFGPGKWDRFLEFLDQTLPRKGDSVQMLLEIGETESEED